jgi:hypothetical protein
MDLEPSSILPEQGEEKASLRSTYKLSPAFAFTPTSTLKITFTTKYFTDVC